MTLHPDTTYFQAHPTEDTSTGPEATSPWAGLCFAGAQGGALRRHPHHDYELHTQVPAIQFLSPRSFLRDTE